MTQRNEPSSASILALDGMLITQGLNTGCVSDEAIDAAQRIAAERGEAVLLEDYDGLWLVPPTGEAAERTTWAAHGFDAPEEDED